MPSLHTPSSRETLKKRSQTLRPDTPARWGRFDAPAMLAHVIQSLHVMNGEVPMPMEKTPWVVRNAPLKHLLIYVLPFPKGLPTSKVLLERASAEVANGAWEAELDALAVALDAIGGRPADGEWPSHAAFGPMTARQWGVLQYRHLDHHFRQFGI